ncbi:unnamed protein product [Hermetia illucens]|uniref:Gustatory receptor n=1 Tax=Hermetia illucens TaxID=343691 RepID=A0A7R8YZ74_HERIL|nr:unnamed protein product [Hermetia illucens]
MLSVADGSWDCFVNFAFVYLQLTGVATFRYDKKRHIIVSSAFWTHYCTVISIASLILVSYEFANEVISKHPYEEKLLSAVSRSGTLFIYASAIFVIGKQWFMRSQFKDFIGRLLSLERKLFQHLEVPQFLNCQFLALFILKSVMSVLLKYLEVRVLFMLYTFDTWMSVLYWFMASIVWHIGAAPLNIFYVIILCMLRFYNIFNGRLKLFARQMELASGIKSSHNKMWEYCRLSDALDTYTSLFADIHNATVDAVEILQFQSLAIFGETYMNTVGRMYFIFLVANTTGMTNEQLIVSVSYVLLSFLVDLLPFFIFTIIVREAQKCEEYAKLENKFWNLDERLERDIEMFALLTTLKKHKIEFGGLVHINRASILSAILSATVHFLILVQFYRAASNTPYVVKNHL